MEPVSAFLKVVDGIIQLLKHRKLQREEFFGKVIKPLFESLPPAVDNLFDFLSETEKIIMHGDYDSKTAAHLRQQRQEYLKSRIQSRSTAEEIAKKSDNIAYKNFAKEVSELFSATVPNIEEDRVILTTSVSSAIVDILDQEISRQARANWNKKHPTPEESKFKFISKPDFDASILLSISLSRNRLESQWEKVSGSYAKLLQDTYS